MPTTITPQDIRDLSPIAREFEHVTDEQLQPFIDEAKFQVSEGEFGDRYKLAVSLLAAHLLTDGASGGSGGAPGVVSSESIGPASRSYAVVAQTADGDPLNLRSTTYGRRLRQLLSTIPRGPAVVFDGVAGNPYA